MTKNIARRVRMFAPGIIALSSGITALYGQAAIDARLIARKLLPAVVTIQTFDGAGNGIALGSGFVVNSKGLIVTNYHVIDKADGATAKFTNGGEERVEGVVEADPEKDYAILKINAIDLPVAALGNSDKLEQGEPLVAIGAPLGLSNTVTTGIVSEIRPLEGGRLMIQHTAPISHGSSGGPLINSAGQVVGVNTLMRTDGNGLYFALPINYIRATLASTDGKVVSLSKVHEIMDKQRKEAAAAKVETFLRENFAPYQDPDHLFSATTPRAWMVQRSEKEEDATRHIIVMFNPREAEKAEINGQLSHGIRIHLRLPAQGHLWKSDSAHTWELRQVDLARNAPATKKISDPAQEKIGNLQALSLLALSDAKNISKPALSWLYISATQPVLATIEIVGPADQEDDLKIVQQVFAESFKAGWVQ